MTQDNPSRHSGLTRLRNYFLTGFIITAPLAITAYLIWTFVQWVDSWVIPYIPEVYNPENYLPFDIPGIGLVIVMFMITIVGFLTANIIGRSIVGYGERLLGRMPLVRNLYNGLKQIFQTVLSDETASFQKVGLLEYPRPGLWAIVFIATDTRGEVGHRLEDRGVKSVSVFLPTTPNPTSGFLLFVPENDIEILDMSVEDGAKLVISAGLVAPSKKAGKDAASGLVIDGKPVSNPASPEKGKKVKEKG
ncbi:MAG: DUF502 domain-containing protein [Nitratireductor sp.]